MSTHVVVAVLEYSIKLGSQLLFLIMTISCKHKTSHTLLTNIPIKHRHGGGKQMLTKGLTKIYSTVTTVLHMQREVPSQ